MPKNKTDKRDRAQTGGIKDGRFANFESDPRFRLPSTKKTKVTIDKRFARALEDPEFTAPAKVDKYGRKIRSDTNKKTLQRLYRVEDDDDEDEDEDEHVETGHDDEVERELAAADRKYDPARGGGFSEPESESDSDSDESEVEEDVAEAEQRGMQRIQDGAANAEEGEVTNRIAIVNLDWDNIKSDDLFALFHSFLPTGARIEKISIYPSEFGKGRMAQESTSGPPREIWKKEKVDDSDSDEAVEDEDEKIKNQLFAEQEGDDQDFDMDRLREYQLDRLRYYYAVMVLADKKTAKELYDKTDGTELFSSSNHLDLRFVPDDITFDDEPRDECDKLPTAYKPVEFTTRALNHSKVELTWDMDPEASRRSETLRKAFSGSRTEINENDLRAYLGSDSSSDEKEEEELGAGQAKLSKKEVARRKMRAALGLPEESSKATSEAAPVGEMQITFTSALSEKPIKEDLAEETTLDKYRRKERERKAKHKEKTVAKREGQDVKHDEAEEIVPLLKDGDDLGFDDPFFMSEEPGAKASKTTLRKEERLKKRALKEAKAAEDQAEKANLELLMADETRDSAAHLEHFDMREVERAQKRKGKKKGKKAQDHDDRGDLQKDFKPDKLMDDPRFQEALTNSEFAIDPSNPKFKATEGMKKILEETRKRRNIDAEEAGERQRKKSKASVSRMVADVQKKAGRR